MKLDRRSFLNLTMAAATLDIVGRSNLAVAKPYSGIKAVVFDGFVIFDPRPIAALVEEVFPGKGAEFVGTWRTRQFEYTWLRTLTGSYVDFWQVTMDALLFTGNLMKVDISPAVRDRLMGAFLHLQAWPDVIPVLTALKRAGVQIAFLSNFSNSMLDANIKSSGLEGFFEDHLSTDRAKAFKPDPRSYQMAVDRFQIRREEIAFAAFGGWDAAGAKLFGYPVFWCNRSRQPAEELGVRPDMVRDDCVDLPSFVGATHAVI